ncbi:EF-P 5-aminopentanol modification-associated protein YfmH [Paracerasibacillus soli]|uniref:Pitrilysin family protein n=1 Tax=Paracerasibacillus soli TaxID=480284 RepID=A0ABU5CPE4_9BACI|nr:pitrilysin family protein [Virgibacillus soli]MDY0408211.1 pitrilysin family protein [Virgibacillus soli]
MHKKDYDYIKETVYTEQLDNGLTVILLPKQGLSKTYAIFSTNYGSIDRTFTPIGQDEMITVPDGVAHFLEHKLFEKKDYDVFADFSKQGASANAFTSFTKTAYLFSATNHVEKNVETLLDFVQDPYFSDQSVEKEKGIIGQEITMYDDQSDWQSFMGTLKALFHEFPVNIDIAGTVTSIDTITKEILYTCYNTFYHPENMTFFVTGNFEPEKMMVLIKQNQAKKSFEKMTEIKREYPKEALEVAHQHYTMHMPVSTPKCTIGIKESVTSLEKDAFVQRDIFQDMILTYFFSKGGPFYEELYDEHLIDASFFFETNLEKTFGYSIIGGNSQKPDEFIRRVKELLMSTRSKVLTDNEVEQMKRKKIGQLIRSLNSLESTANKFIHYHTVGVDYFSLIPTIQSVTTEDANRFLQDWIKQNVWLQA